MLRESLCRSHKYRELFADSIAFSLASFDFPIAIPTQVLLGSSYFLASFSFRSLIVGSVQRASLPTPRELINTAETVRFSSLLLFVNPRR